MEGKLEENCIIIITIYVEMLEFFYYFVCYSLSSFFGGKMGKEKMFFVLTTKLCSSLYCSGNFKRNNFESFITKQNVFYSFFFFLEFLWYTLKENVITF